MAQKAKISDALVHFFLFICIAVLIGGFLFLLKEISQVREQKIETKTQISEKLIPTSKPAETSKAIVIKLETKTLKEKRITYLNLAGQFTTQGTDWTDIKSTDALINLEEEYGNEAYVDWEASVKTASSGSKVFVRLYDVTHNIGVNGSELETSSTTSARVSSGRLYLWRGQNTYRVQIKSLNGIDATFEGGRIKIVY